MRLLYITAHYPPIPGGMAGSCGRQVAGLRKAGNHVDVLILGRLEASDEPAEFPRQGGTDWVLPLQRNFGYVAQTAYRQVLSRQTAGAYDWVVGFGANFPGFLAGVFGKWLRKPSLILVRGNDFDRDWFDPRAGFWVKESLSQATVVGTLSRETSERIRALIKPQYLVQLVNSVDPDEFSLFVHDRQFATELRQDPAFAGKPVVGLFGELKDKKGIPEWLRSVRRAGLTGSFGLLLVGRIDEALRALLQDPLLSPSIRIFDFQSRTDLPRYLAACDFISVPSLFEGMPNILLEAMVLGKIPVVSDAGALPEVVQDGVTGFVFPAGNWEKSAEALARALTLSAEARETMSTAARRHILEHHSPEKEVKGLMDTMEENQKLTLPV